MNIKIRQEQPEEYFETENMVREAFWNHYSPGCNEHYLMHTVRSCPAFLPELDFVAADNGKVIGNIVYIKNIVRGDDGTDYEVLGIGPISVLPEYQGKGVGGTLIKQTRELARQMGFRAVFLCGDPSYYSRHGFIAAEQLGIRMADNMYAAALQVCELYQGALSGVKGCYIENSAYEIDEAAAAEYDRLFPVKEKVGGTPSQKRFDEVVAMRRKPSEVDGAKR